MASKFWDDLKEKSDATRVKKPVIDEQESKNREMNADANRRHDKEVEDAARKKELEGDPEGASELRKQKAFPGKGEEKPKKEKKSFASRFFSGME